MKRVIITLIFFGALFFISETYAQTVRIIQQNVGRDGCNSSEERIENGIHFLICQEPGKQKCKTEMYLKHKKERKIVSKVIKQVNKEIENDELEGIFHFQGHKVTYEAEDAFNLKITIEYE